ncbi:MAG: four helix bundle protein [Terracidiphilus sp.]
MGGKLAAQSFRELVVWQRAMQLTVAIYRLSGDFPREERFGLTSQIRRSAVSIPSNIAEGQGRRGVGEFKQFLGIARGSNFEVQTQLEIARALKFGKPALIDEAESLSHEVGKMVYALSDSISGSTHGN